MTPEWPSLCFGCWGIVGGLNWGIQHKKDSIAALQAAYDSGIIFLDTAEMYGDGYSEQLIAEALGDKRKELLIASKVSPQHFEPAKLRAACERSLQNLQTDYLDLYQLHWPNRDIPIEEALETLDALKEEGKIRHYGVSNFGTGDLGEALSHSDAILTNQLAYSLLFRAIEFEIQPLCTQNNVGILCYSPLLHGLLTGKFRSPQEVPEDRARTRHFAGTWAQARHGEEGAEEEMFEAINRIRSIAEELGESMADIALAWLMVQDGVTSVIAGGRNAEQVRRNARAASIQLTPDVVQALTLATDALKDKLGPNPDMWQSKPRIK